MLKNARSIPHDILEVAILLENTANVLLMQAVNTLNLASSTTDYFELFIKPLKPITMKTKFTFMLLMMIALGTTKMFAQSDYKKVRIGLGLEGALPVGATANAYN